MATMIIRNPDIDYTKAMLKAIENNDGYCPCKLERTKNTKCMCLEFKEQDAGECQCGLYIKVKESEMVK